MCFLHTKWVAKMGRVSSANGLVRDEGFMPGSHSDHGWIMLESSVFWRQHVRDSSIKS